MSPTTQASPMTDAKRTGDGKQHQAPAGPVRADTAAETRTTLILVVIALVCVGVTAAVEYMTKPAEIAEYGKVGQEFYPDFIDPTQATSLLVRTVDKDSARAIEFSVRRNENGQWVIPSHHNYPADAEERLAKTAASVIGIKRGALVTRWASDHSRYGVVDPSRDTLDVEELEGVGTRLVLRGKDDSVLFDLIIGKKVEGEGDENQFYVRHPDEDEVYIATLDIDLSTRFSDWIDTDLLAIDSFDTRLLEIRDYEFDELKGTLTQAEISRLTRDSSSSDWKLSGLDETKFEVDQQKVRDTVNTLANLEIVGVRPKQPGLTPELTLDRNVIKSQRDIDQLQSDLLARGFLLQPGADGDPNTLKLLAREGEMTVATEDAVAYDLYFGRAFTGTQEELELGFAKSTSDREGNAEADGSDQPDGQGTEESSPGDANDNENGDDGAQEGRAKDSGAENSDENNDSSKKPGRYVFVRARVETAVLGEPPAVPVEPEKPEALKKAEEKASDQAGDGNADQNDTDAGSDDGDDGEGPSSTEEASESNNGTGETETSAKDAADGETQDGEQSAGDSGEGPAGADAELEKLKAEYEQAVAQYEEAKRKYDDYQEKLKTAQEKVSELNRRFAKWYYVIPGEDYEKLALHRSDLIQEKQPPETDGSDGPPSDGEGLSLPPNPLSNAQPPAADGGDSTSAGSSGSGDATAPGGDEMPPAPENPRGRESQAGEGSASEPPAPNSSEPIEEPPAPPERSLDGPGKEDTAPSSGEASPTPSDEQGAGPEPESTGTGSGN